MICSSLFASFIIDKKFEHNVSTNSLGEQLIYSEWWPLMVLGIGRQLEKNELGDKKNFLKASKIEDERMEAIVLVARMMLG
jgi:hypothetical protein